jgi:hypothetical protein
MIDFLVLHGCAAVFVGIVIVLMGWNAFNRARWDAGWNGGIDIPERRRKGYNEEDLKQFREEAASRRMLVSYVGILRGSDIWFAIALSAVTVWLWHVFAADRDWLKWIAVPCALFALAYGIADVMEDRKLSALLSRSGTIDSAEAAAASRLTRIKIGTLTASLIGGRSSC